MRYIYGRLLVEVRYFGARRRLPSRGMVLLADVASGETDLADIAFLVAVVLAVVAGVAASGKAAVLAGWAIACGWFAVAALALGLLLL